MSVKNLKDSLSKINGISSFQSEKLVTMMLLDKENAIISLENIVSKIRKASLCDRCGLFKFEDNCKNCNIKSEDLNVFETLEDYFSFLKKTNLYSKSFVMGFKSKSDYLNLDKLNYMSQRINLLYNFSNFNNLRFLLPPSVELDILTKFIRSETNINLKFKKFPIGVPLNTNISLLDKKTLIKLMEKN